MDIVRRLHPQARARNNALTSMRAMQVRRGQTEEAERAVTAAAATVTSRAGGRGMSGSSG